MIFVLFLSELVISDSWNQLVTLADWISNPLGISTIWDFQHKEDAGVLQGPSYLQSSEAHMCVCFEMKMTGASVGTKVKRWGGEAP